jgi:hypothetical protein
VGEGREKGENLKEWCERVAKLVVHERRILGQKQMCLRVAPYLQLVVMSEGVQMVNLHRQMSLQPTKEGKVAVLYIATC